MHLPLSSPFQAGFARASVTAFDPAMCLWGWGYPDNVGLSVAAPLFARALVLEHVPSASRMVYVCCDLGMISESVRAHVLSQIADLGFSEHSVMLTATHTHSGPSGFSSYLFYAMAGPGYSRSVHDTIVDGIVAAIRQAVERRTPALLRVGSGQVPLDEDLAFNRAVRSYNRNPDVAPLDRSQRAAAVDRTMTVLRVDAVDGRPLGLLSWFGVHCTTVHRDHKVIHPDHKGAAAVYLEEQNAKDNPDYVAIFAQTAPGDVSPNNRWDGQRGFTVGPLEDDLASAALLGRKQAEQARAIANEALQRSALGMEGDGQDAGALPFSCALRYVDFFCAPADPQFVGGRSGLRSAPPMLGWAYTAGTREGPGPFQPVHRLTSSLVRLLHPLSRSVLQRSMQSSSIEQKKEPASDSKTDSFFAAQIDREALALQGPKFPFIQLHRGRRNRLCGVIPATSPVLGLVRNPFVDYLRRAVQDSAAASQPWVPRFLPVQIAHIGPLVVAALPMEPTVQSGRRLAQAVAAELGPSARHVVVNGYANAYAAYLTTPEEYAAQRYEGSATLFGQWSLPAFCTAFASLARTMRDSYQPGKTPILSGDLGPRPIPISLEDALPARLAAQS